MKQRIKWLLSTTLLLSIATGCGKDPVVTYNKSNVIRPTVASVNLAKATTDQPARKQIAAIPVSEDPENPLYILVFEQDMTERDAIAQTKGAEVTATNLSSFNMKAYAESQWHNNETGESHEAGEYFGSTAVTKSGTNWNMASTQYWLNSVNMSFWSWNTTAPTITPADGFNKASFSHSVSGKTAEQEPDLIFAYNRENRTFNDSGEISSGSGTYSSTENNTVNIHFYHALSAIRFDVSGVAEGISVDKIELSGLKVAGNCTIDATKLDATNYSSAFGWTTTGDNSSVNQEFTSTDFGTGGVYKPGTDKEFMMIPQTLTSDSEITVYFDGSATGITKKLNPESGTTTWKPGKYYTYKLSRNAYDWDYTFTIDGGDLAVLNCGENITGNYYEILNNIHSKRTRTDDTSIEEDVSWTIKSYRIGDGGAVDVNASSFNINLSSSTSWIGAKYNSASEINIYELKCNPSTRNTHDYWTGDHGDWSPADWSEQGVIDLSKMDYRTDVVADAINAHDMTTANCYIIRHAGTYKFPLVYGNAMKGGGENFGAYAPRITDTGCEDVFVNHLDADITSAFIENNANCVADPGKVAILWQDKAEVVKNVQIIPSTSTVTPGSYIASNVRYVQFSVSQEDICQNNAVIAIKDADGKILWSWHIWITNNPDVTKAIQVSNWDDHTYHFFGIDNIGSISGDVYDDRRDVTLTLKQDNSNLTVDLRIHQIIPKKISSFMFFQWGRKDPFLYSPGAYTGNVYDYKGDIVNTIVPVTSSDDVKTIGYAIQNPTEFRGYVETTSYEWANPLPLNAWAGRESGNGLVENSSTTIKTIYDPSPVFYMVPAVGAYSGFADEPIKMYSSSEGNVHRNGPSTASSVGGFSFYTSLGSDHHINTGGPEIWFSINGMRPGGAHYNDRNNEGWYYTSSLTNDGKSRFLNFENGKFIFISNASRSNGHSVRPILEADFESDGGLNLTPDPDDWTDGGGDISL